MQWQIQLKVIFNRTEHFSFLFSDVSFRSSHPEVLLQKGVLKISRKFTGEHPWRSAISQLYWNRTSAWVFCCKFAAYFQNIFSKEHIWTATSDFCYLKTISFRHSHLYYNVSGYWEKDNKIKQIDIKRPSPRHRQ